jgi:hypothetical protein
VKGKALKNDKSRDNVKVDGARDSHLSSIFIEVTTKSKKWEELRVVGKRKGVGKAGSSGVYYKAFALCVIKNEFTFITRWY